MSETRSGSERRRLASMVSVRFLPAEEAAVRAAADRAGESVSNFIRQAVLDACSGGPSGQCTLSWSRPPTEAIGGRRVGTSSSTTLVRFVVSVA